MILIGLKLIVIMDMNLIKKIRDTKRMVIDIVKNAYQNGKGINHDKILEFLEATDLPSRLSDEGK